MIGTSEQAVRPATAAEVEPLATAAGVAAVLAILDCGLHLAAARLRLGAARRSWRWP